MTVHIPVFEAWRLVRTADTIYRVIEKLGTGGNSIVYLVQSISGNSQGLLFALKILFNIGKADRVERFATELKFLKECNHPSILGVHDSGSLPDTQAGSAVSYPFVIAEFLPKTLRSAQRAGLSMAEKIAFCTQLLSALAYLDAKGIVHRDIKPENIFVKGRACILGDFGLLKSIDPDEHEFGIEHSEGVRHPYLYPTPDLIAYCKDEKNNPLTSKSDVFQLGLVFSELFSGQLPLLPRKKALDPIIFHRPMPKFDGLQAQTISLLIDKMLIENADQRPSAQVLIDQWMGVFREVFQAHLSLEGNVFATPST
jgi:serine/threonine protein kinase